MENKNCRIFLLFLFICIFCLFYLVFNYPANAQDLFNSYYVPMTPNLASSYLYNSIYSNSNTMYSTDYSWSVTQNFGKGVNIPTLLIDDWIVHPAFGITVYAATTEGDNLTIHGTYFSAHTHAGVNFNRTLSFDNPLYSMSYKQPSQIMYQNLGSQSSYISPSNDYVRQVLQFSPVLHGPLLYN